MTLLFFTMLFIVIVTPIFMPTLYTNIIIINTGI